MNLADYIRDIPDFPKPGILFYDISTLLADANAWQMTVRRLASALRPHQPDLLVGIESRGFLVAAPLAYELGRGFAMVRKHLGESRWMLGLSLLAVFWFSWLSVYVTAWGQERMRKFAGSDRAETQVRMLRSMGGEGMEINAAAATSCSRADRAGSVSPPRWAR